MICTAATHPRGILQLEEGPTSPTQLQPVFIFQQEISQGARVSSLTWML